jgi:hypothetical protein
MCWNIRTLFNYEPPTTDDQVRASAMQFVRKLSGFTEPSNVNEAVFNRAVDDIAAITRDLVNNLKTTAPAKDRADEAAQVKARARRRFDAA